MSCTKYLKHSFLDQHLPKLTIINISTPVLIVNKVMVKMAMVKIMIRILFPDGDDRQRQELCV